MGDFGVKHVTGLAWLISLITIALVILLVIRKKYNKGEQYDSAVIRYTCYFMWAWEIIKTIRMINYTDYGPVGTYPLWMAPFHICSMGLYAYLIIGSKKQSKLKEWVKPYAFATLFICTTIVLMTPDSAGLLGTVPNWSFCFDNILPFQTFFYHGCLWFVSLYMIFSGFYKPQWKDIYRAATVLGVTAAFAFALNYILEGSGADYMMLRYGRGNPLAFLLESSPLLYYVILAAISIGGTALVISIAIGIQKLISVCKNRKIKHTEV